MFLSEMGVNSLLYRGAFISDNFTSILLYISVCRMALLNFYKTLENATRRPMTSSIGQQDFPSSDAGAYSLQQGCV